MNTRQDWDRPLYAVVVRDGKHFNRFHRRWEVLDTTRWHEYTMDPGQAARIVAETEVQDPAVAPDVAAPAAPAADPKDAPSALDDAKDQAEERPDVGGAKPPEDGQCRECKRLRRLNRLKLCYPCFVELVIMDEAKKRGHQWKPGDAHPSWCACEGLGEHPDRDNGAWRGN